MEGEVNKLMQLKYMGDVGAKQAIEVLSMMLDMDVDMKIAAVNMSSIHSIPEVVGSGEIVALYTRFNGDINGTMLLLLTPDSALKLSSALIGDFPDEESEDLFNDMQKSASVEICNIITSAFIDVWANTFSIELTHNPPEFGYDYSDAIIEKALGDATKTGEFVVYFNSTLNIINMDINFNIMLMPDPGNLQTVFDMFENIDYHT